jgi:xylulose-5-phosphate/fructose-6-phosphate phosphoketolase
MEPAAANATGLEETLVASVSAPIKAQKKKRDKAKTKSGGPTQVVASESATRAEHDGRRAASDYAPTFPHRTVTDPTPETLAALDAWWRAANYLSVGQIYLLDNPLLRRPLTRDDIKPRLLGHWGTTPGLNLIYAHLNRAIQERGLDTIYVTGPGHGGPGMVANAYLDGTYSEVYAHIKRDEDGLRRLFRQFSFPGGIPSHVAPETPGSIHEGGELGYSLSHAYGAAFDNPDLLVACVIGDGEAETGPLATSWHSNKFIDPRQDGVVLPILHLNGYKIANPTVLARIPEDELLELLRGYGHKPYLVSGGFDDEDPIEVHKRFARVLDEVLNDIATIKADARAGLYDAAPGDEQGGPVPAWPMIVLRTPKGWTCPRFIDGVQVEGTYRAHQVPLANARDTEEHTRILEGWLREYRPEELFDDDGAPVALATALAPRGDKRMSANPVTNGGLLRKELTLRDFRDFAVDVPAPGATVAEATKVLGQWLATVIEDNPTTFRIFGPDETASNRLAPAVYEYTGKQWNAEIWETDDRLARAGRVMEMLSEHQCEGWLEGYLLTGRHGLFNCYEAFIHIIDSMFNQHAKWLKVTREIPWRRPISSLNYLLSSHVWRQDHNGFSHQDPGFIDHVVNKSADVVRVYLPFDANTLLSTYDHCLRSVDYVNVVVAGKQPAANWLTMDQAIAHCTRGLGIFDWAGTEVQGQAPDVVLAAAGDIPTLEVLAAAKILREQIPDLKVRVVNVVDLMRLQSASEHPHGLSDQEFDAIFTTDRPIIFAYHGYPWLIHRLTYRRHGHDNIHARGYKENGTTTTPFDMVMLNDLDRYHLVIDVIDRVPGLAERYAELRQSMQDARLVARQYTREHGEDIPEVANWAWGHDSVGHDQSGADEEVNLSSDTGGDNA